MSDVADLRKFFAALESMHPAGPAAIEQLHTALEQIPLTVQHRKEKAMATTHQRVTRILDELNAQTIPAAAAKRGPSPFKPGGYFHLHSADPTRPPRRTANPRLRVRSVHGLPLLVLPAADSRNLTGTPARLWCAEWEIWLIDEDGQERLVEWADSGELALDALPRLMHELGILNEDGSRPTAKGGASDAA